MMHLPSSKMVEPRGPTGKGAAEEEIRRKARQRTLHRCSKVVEGGEQRWRKVCKGRSSDQLVNTTFNIQAIRALEIKRSEAM